MTEAQARKLCTDRQRNPDREMTGPDGPLKAWMLYTAPLDHGLVQSYIHGTVGTAPYLLTAYTMAKD